MAPAISADNPPANSAPLLTVEQVAKRFACSTRSVYRLVDRGDLVPIKIGALVRFTEDQISAYLAR